MILRSALVLGLAGLVTAAGIPVEVTHTRCLVLEAGDETATFYRVVTRDDLDAAAAAREGCRRIRFRRQWGFEDIADE